MLFVKVLLNIDKIFLKKHKNKNEVPMTIISDNSWEKTVNFRNENKNGVYMDIKCSNNLRYLFMGYITLNIELCFKSDMYSYIKSELRKYSDQLPKGKNGYIVKMGSYEPIYAVFEYSKKDGVSNLRIIYKLEDPE